MDLNKSSADYSCNGEGLLKQLSLLNQVTKQEFDQAEELIQSRLQSAISSLEQSSTAIRMMLSAQSPAEQASEAGIAMRRDLEALLASSTHLNRMANLMQADFRASRRACEQQTDGSIDRVVAAIGQHRSDVQDNAIAMTEAALAKARAPSSGIPARRITDRRPR